MKKEELKASLDRIQPREELINSTLAKVHEQQAKEHRKQTKETTFFPAVYQRGLRLAGAVCAFALVFSIGFAVARLGGTDPITTPNGPGAKLAGTLDTDNVSNNYGVHTATYSLIGADEWIALRGNVTTLHFSDLTEDELAMGALAGGKVTISVQSIEGRSEELSRKTISTEITADFLLYDTESLNLLVNASESDLLIRLIPTEEDGWEIHDFFPAE